MKKLFFCFLFFCLPVTQVSQAFGQQRLNNRNENQTDVSPGKPKIILKIDKGNISYIHTNKEIECKIKSAAGCTTVEMFTDLKSVELTESGEIKTIYLTVGLKKIHVEISTEYPKGSCKFDLVLKHELTHVTLIRGIVDKYAPEAAKAVLINAGQFSAPLPQNFQNQLSDVAKRYFNKMVDEKDKQDEILDSKGNNAYQWDQCSDNDSALSAQSGKERHYRRQK